MRLKILIIPLVFLLLLVLVIGFVKPDIDTLQEKMVALETKSNQAKNLASLLRNIDTLTAELNQQSEAEQFVKTYLPANLDQDSVMDKLNFLATQSGVFPDLITMHDVATKAAVDENGAPIDTTTSSGKVQMKVYTVQITVKGGYSNIKDFLSRVAHVNRYHKTSLFALKNNKANQAADPAVTASDSLVGTFEASFDYLPLRSVDSALHAPIFSQAKLDTTKLDATVKWVTSTVPAFSGGATGSSVGRPNPFY